MKHPETFTLIVDVVQRRPACVLLQAVYHCPHALVSRWFAPQTWLVAPTPHMRRVTGTQEQWRRFAAEINDARLPASSHPATAEEAQPK